MTGFPPVASIPIQDSLTAGNDLFSVHIGEEDRSIDDVTPGDTSGDSLGYRHPIRGTVYLDGNGNGTRDATEAGLAGIVVSDGYDVVRTDEAGDYVLPNAAGHAVFVFVHQTDDVKQTGQEFFHRLRYDAGAQERFDFALEPAGDSGSVTDSPLRFVQLSDSHVRNESDRDYMKQATAQIYQMDPLPDFVVLTGDMVDWGVDEHFQNYLAGMQTPPLPYFHVFGNHEIVFGPIERYYHYLGPDYFSFERGGILFLALNWVTSPERQEVWLARTLDVLGAGRPVVFFQHFPPSLEDLEAFAEMGVRSVFSGHWHSEKEMEHAGVQSINSPPFIMGGIDASPAGLKVVEMKADGTAETGWRYGFQDKQLTIVSPQGDAPVNGGLFPVIVNTYDTSHDVVSVRWRMGSEEGRVASGELQRESATSWTGMAGAVYSGASSDSAGLPVGRYLFDVEVEDEQGRMWTARRSIEVGRGRPGVPAPVGEWPMFMGDSEHTGYTSETIENFPLRLAWSVDTGGDPDFASPVLAGGRVYVSLKKRTGSRLQGVAAFDAVTGDRLWLFETPMAVNHSVAYAGGNLCVAGMGGRVYGVDAASGRQRWYHDLIDNRGRYNYGAPGVQDGWCYAGVMRRMAKLRMADGHLEWDERIGRSDHDWISSYGSPAVSGDYLAMAGMFFAGETVTIARTEDGSRIWGHTADDGMLAGTTIAGDRLLFTTMKSILYAQRLSDGKDVWSLELGGEGEELNELGLATGGNAKWSATTPAVKLTGGGSGIVVAGSGDGYMSGVNLADGELLWTHVSGPTVFKVSPYRRDERPLLSSPTIAGDKVFFGSADGHVYCLDLQTGKELWSYDLGVSVMSTPVVSGNTVYVTGYDGRLYAFTEGK